MGHRSSIAFMISSAHRTASAIALIVAGTLFPPSNCANLRAARILAAINSTRLRPSSTPTRVAYSYFVRLLPKWILLPIRDQIGFRLPNRLPKVAVLAKKKYPLQLGNSKQGQYEVFDRQCFSQCLRGFRKIFGGSHSLCHSTHTTLRTT